MKCGPGRWRPAVAPRNATRGAGELESSSRTTLLDTQRPRAPARVREMPTSGSAHPGPAPRRDPGPGPCCSSARRPLGTPGGGIPASGGARGQRWPPRGPPASAAASCREGRTRRGGRKGPPQKFPRGDPRSGGAAFPPARYPFPTVPATPLLSVVTKSHYFPYLQSVSRHFKCFPANICY